jgi:hypothetical protein
MNLTADQKQWAATGPRTRKACQTYAREHAPRGQRGKLAEALYDFSKEAAELRQERREARRVEPTPKLQDRLHSRLITITQRQATERRLTTPTCSPRQGTVEDYDPDRRMWLINVERKHHYSNAFGDWWVRASWLAGHDDSGYWAVRVPGTILGIDEALDWITPAAVQRAESQGRQVLRQGDVYLVEKRRGPDNTRDLPRRHYFDPETRTLSHSDHADLHIPWPFRAYAQRQLSSTSQGAFGRAGD